MRTAVSKLSHRVSFLNERRIRIVSAILLLHAVALYSFSRQEFPPNVAPLQQFSSDIGAWTLDSDESMGKEILDRLHPDDYLIRSYTNSASASSIGLFVAYFRTQRTGHLPHSPKNCLPGNGWVPESVEVIEIPVDGGSMRVNRNIVQKGGSRALVFYWYQNWNRVDASEYAARAHLVLDAIRYDRTDTALVRVTVPLTPDEKTANSTAVGFAQMVYGLMQKQLLPGTQAGT
jgi:EpsI family protein